MSANNPGFGLEERITSAHPSAARRSEVNLRLPLIYLGAIVVAEVATALYSPLVGIVLHIAVMLALVVHASLRSQDSLSRFYLALSVTPLVRILSLAMPLGGVPVLYRYAIVAVPLLAATLLAIRYCGYTRREVGFTLDWAPLQLLIGLLGVPLGAVEYLILKPAPLSSGTTLEAILLPAVVLLIATGLMEELLFRGLLQRAAEVLGDRALTYSTLLFAAFYVGYLNVFQVIFAFGVGLVFGRLVRRTRSILGVTLAHGLLNVTVFLLVPLWGLPYLAQQNVQMPDVGAWLRSIDPPSPFATPVTSSPAVAVGAQPSPPTRVEIRVPGKSQPLVVEPLKHAVEPWETVKSLAEQYGVTEEALRALNGLSAGSELAAGQRVAVPVVVHTVARGEALWQIAAAYGTTARRIVEANQLANPNAIVPGQRLLVPIDGLATPAP